MNNSCVPSAFVFTLYVLLRFRVIHTSLQQAPIEFMHFFPYVALTALASLFDPKEFRKGIALAISSWMWMAFA